MRVFAARNSLQRKCRTGRKSADVEISPVLVDGIAETMETIEVRIEKRPPEDGQLRKRGWRRNGRPS
jgi:hypothetical protein